MIIGVSTLSRRKKARKQEQSGLHHNDTLTVVVKLGGGHRGRGESGNSEALADGVLAVEGQVDGVSLRAPRVRDVAAGLSRTHHVRLLHSLAAVGCCDSGGGCQVYW